MPVTEHNHPDYEQTFSRVATILDVLAQEQLATERALREFIAEARERDAETKARLNELSRTTAELSRTTAELSKTTAASINDLRELSKETKDGLNELRAIFRERDAETTDKLNGLIDLMDRHLREHGKQ